MRIDKYLKVCRLIKRRVIAKEIVGDGVIIHNQRIAKPANQLSVGDILELHLGRHRLVIKVTSIDVKTSQQDPKAMYEVLLDEVITPIN